MLFLHKPSTNLRILTTRSTICLRNYCKDKKSTDDEINNKIKNSHEENPDATLDYKETASARLNRLLASMQTADDSFNLLKTSSVSVGTSPGELNRKRNARIKSEAENKDIFIAAKKVANLLGESNQKQVESELLIKLLGHEQITNKNQVSGENELSLSEIIVGMKIDRNRKHEDIVRSRGDYVKRSIAIKQQHQNIGSERKPIPSRRKAEAFTGSVNLFGGKSMGVFTQPRNLKASPDMLSTWFHLQQHSTKLQISHPPANYYEKMALWTEQGKLWHFPINNEQDLDDEHDVDFSDHIFLEQHLESWCPKQGPIRHFMELVCVGLSKNPYLTAKEKKAHILWYRDYFEAKKEILKDLLNKESLGQLVASDSKNNAKI
uniref:Small ribosomal subunit protein mS31 n=1 Tax=Glossina brevipalpis TaxID=37001 RepID=A0A1A9WDH7_9MUSC